MLQLHQHRFYVKIRGGKNEGLAECVYYKANMTFEFYFRWRWFFKYRAALYQVQNPKHFVVLDNGRYEYVEQAEEKRVRLANKIKSKKAKVTELQNKLKLAQDHWLLNNLFSIEDDPIYKRAVAKIESKKAELVAIQLEYNSLNLE